MSYLYAGINQREKQNKMYMAVRSDESFYMSADKMIGEKIPYDNETKIDDEAWFYIKNFSSTKHSIYQLTADINSADYNALTIEAFKKTTYLFSVSDDQNERYFQKVGKAALVERKRFIRFGNEFIYRPECASIVINDLPDAIYLKDTDTLFFKKLSTLTGIFPEISNLYKKATDEETKNFLNTRFFALEGFTPDQVHIPNRKRIALAMEILKTFDDSQKNEIYNYIGEYCPDIHHNDGRFTIKSNEDLSLVLYGIGQRFYTTPISKEKRIANSVIKL